MSEFNEKLIKLQENIDNLADIMTVGQARLEHKIKVQKKHISQLTRTIDRQKFVIKKLIGGLFNPTSDQQTLSSYYKCLESESNPYEIFDDPTAFTSFSRLPTTRQGDDNERRMDRLEDIVDKMITDFYIVPPEYMVTESDMSDDFSDDGTTRRENSFTLCGNE